MNLKNYLLVTTAMALGAFANQSFAQDNYILGGHIMLEEGKTLTEVVDTYFANPEPLDFANLDFEDHLAMNINDLYNPGFSPIPSGFLKWKALPEESNIPDGWLAYQLCDNFQCFSMFSETDGWYYEEDYFVFQEIEGMGRSDFYTSMYYPESTTATYGEIVVELVYDDAENAFTDTMYFGFINAGVAINELSPESIAIYPNPASDVLNVSLKDASTLKSVGLFDINGRQIYLKHSINSYTHQVNMEGLAQGVYLLRIENMNGESAIKKVQKL